MENNIVNYRQLVEVFGNLENIEMDFDTVELLDENIDAIKDLSTSDLFAQFSMSVDDTTADYSAELIGQSAKLLKVITPIVDEFNGISQKQRAELQKSLPGFLVGYGIILYKTRGYEILAEALLEDPSSDISKLELTPALMEDLAEDRDGVIATIHSILTVFRTFGSYFPEYQVNNEEDLIKLEDHMESIGKGVDGLVNLTEKEVRDILRGN